VQDDLRCLQTFRRRGYKTVPELSPALAVPA
jgi:hypothetical protein